MNIGSTLRCFSARSTMPRPISGSVDAVDEITMSKRDSSCGSSDRSSARDGTPVAARRFARCWPRSSVRLAMAISARLLRGEVRRDEFDHLARADEERCVARSSRSKMRSRQAHRRGGHRDAGRADRGARAHRLRDRERAVERLVAAACRACRRLRPRARRPSSARGSAARRAPSNRGRSRHGTRGAPHSPSTCQYQCGSSASAASDGGRRSSARARRAAPGIASAGLVAGRVDLGAIAGRQHDRVRQRAREATGQRAQRRRELLGRDRDALPQRQRRRGMVESEGQKSHGMGTNAASACAPDGPGATSAACGQPWIIPGRPRSPSAARRLPDRSRSGRAGRAGSRSRRPASRDRPIAVPSPSLLRSRETCVSIVRDEMSASPPQTTSRMCWRDIGRPALRNSSSPRSNSFCVIVTRRASDAVGRDLDLARLGVEAIRLERVALERLVRIRASQQRLQPRDQFGRADRLDQVVVGAARQARR